MGNFNDRGGRGGDRRGGGGGFNRGGDRHGGGFNRDRGDRPTMHKAICDACKSNCEVPFKPTGNKPIFCSDCFSKQGGGNDRPRFVGGDRDRKPSFVSGGGSSDNSKDILKGIKTLNYKLDELIKALGHNTPSEKTTEPEATPRKASNKKVAKKKAGKKSSGPKIVAPKKTPKKKPVAKKPVKKNKK